MAKNMDKDNDDLLEALESIKDLLEKGENKLTAARESLARAKPSRPKPRFPVSDEPVVPVLDDVVAPASEDDAEMVFDDGIPELIPEPDVAASAVPPPPPPGYSTDEVLAMIDTLHDTLAKELHDSLINAVVHIEADLKASLDEPIRRLREQLEQDRKD